MMKPNRNDVCPCGSGKKFKKCCIDKPEYQSTAPFPSPSTVPTPAEMDRIVALFSSGQKEALEGESRLLVERCPTSGWAWKSWGVALMLVGKECLSALQKAAQLRPDDAEVENWLGLALYAAGARQDALPHFRRAIQMNPNFAEARISLADALLNQGQLREAQEHLLLAVKMRPDIATGHMNLGVALSKSGRLKEAEESLRRAIALAPLNVDALNNLGVVLRDMNRLDEAEVCLRQSIQLEPHKPLAHSLLGVVLKNVGRSAEAEAAFRQALALQPEFADAIQNLISILNLRFEANEDEIIALARDYDKCVGEPFRAAWPAHARGGDVARRLRVGYVSADFKRHAVAQFFEPLLAHHDASAVEVFCYANVEAEDDWTERLKGLAHHWHSILGLSDTAAAQLIASHQIDVLVDLSGHSSGNRLPVFARKPAPVQMTYMGYPGTTGLHAMDYKIMDIYSAPSELADKAYTERILRLPHSLWCYQPDVTMPEPSALPALERGYLTFGSFNNFNKIDQPSLQLWAELLRAVPQSRLLLLTVPEGAARANLVKAFAERGVDATRLEFHGRVDQATFQKMFLQVDVSLDPISVNGATTTCESLWMGVPVISLVGSRFLMRAGYSILQTAGLPEFVAESPADYLNIALRLHNNLPELAALRSSLRARLQQTPLTDAVRFTRNLEALYRSAWAEWCETSS